MDSLADKLVDYILGLDNTTLTEGELFVGERPSQPTNCITFYDAPGFSNAERDTTIRPSVQVIVRNEGYIDGFSKSYEVYDLLRQKYAFWLIEDSIWAVRVEPQNEPGFVGKEEDNFMFSANFNLWVKYY